jgi:hypothetical protein
MLASADSDDIVTLVCGVGAGTAVAGVFVVAGAGAVDVMEETVMMISF